MSKVSANRTAMRDDERPVSGTDLRADLCVCDGMNERIFDCRIEIEAAFGCVRVPLPSLTHNYHVFNALRNGEGGTGVRRVEWGKCELDE